MNKQKYLQITWKKLRSPYGIIYLLFMVVTILSDRPPLQATFWFWLVCGALFLGEYYRSYWTIEKDVLRRQALFSSVTIPLIKVTSLVKGKPFGLAHWENMKCVYSNEKNESKELLIGLMNYEPQDIGKFIADLKSANSQIAVDENLKKWLEKKGVKV